MKYHYALAGLIAVVFTLTISRAQVPPTNKKQDKRELQARDVYDAKKTVMFQDDFRAKVEPLRLWNYSENDQYKLNAVTPSRIAVVDAPGLEPGHKAVRFVVDRAPNSFRSELSLPHENGFKERWYAGRILIPNEWVFDPVKGDDIVMQWHAISGDWRATFPNLAISVDNDRWYVKQNYGDPKTKPTRTNTKLDDPVLRGKWVSWVIHAKWSPKDDGLLQIWRDGKLVIDRKGPNVYGTIGVEYTPYMKTGIYHPVWNLKTAERREAFENVKPVATKKIVYVTDIKIGNETAKYEDVAPAPALAPLPDKKGFAGSFAGVSNESLVVAGGANFPNKQSWDGGKKVWHEDVFVLERPGGKWRVAGKLPRPLGYGVSVTHGNGVICVGGSDAERHYADTFKLEWKDGKLVTTDLPTLPKALANACGAMVGDTLYVAGGQEKLSATETAQAVYRIDLSAANPKWVEVEACPGGGRMLSVAAGFDGAFWLASGVDLVVGKDGKMERKYLKDAYRFDSTKGWKRVADLPRPVAAAPSPAPVDGSGFYVLGGDDGTQVGSAPDKHRGFAKTVLRYDLSTDHWVEAGEVAEPRVTVPCVAWGKSWAIPSGELRPGVRSPDVTTFIPAKKE